MLWIFYTKQTKRCYFKTQKWKKSDINANIFITNCPWAQAIDIYSCSDMNVVSMNSCILNISVDQKTIHSASIYFERGWKCYLTFTHIKRRIVAFAPRKKLIQLSLNVEINKTDVLHFRHSVCMCECVHFIFRYYYKQYFIQPNLIHPIKCHWI